MWFLLPYFSLDADDEGWETVQRSKQNRQRPSSGKNANNGRNATAASNSVHSSTNGPIPPHKAPSNPALAKPRDRADSEKENRPDHVSCFYPNTCGVILCFELVICAKKDFNLFYYHVCLVNINKQRSELDNSNNSTKRRKKKNWEEEPKKEKDKVQLKSYDAIMVYSFYMYVVYYKSCMSGRKLWTAILCYDYRRKDLPLWREQLRGRVSSRGFLW